MLRTRSFPWFSVGYSTVSIDMLSSSEWPVSYGGLGERLVHNSISAKCHYSAEAVHPSSEVGFLESRLFFPVLTVTAAMYSYVVYAVESSVGLSVRGSEWHSVWSLGPSLDVPH